MKEQWKPEKRLENKKEKISPGFSQTSLRFKYKNNSPIGPGDY